jgi:hypothetical protein
MNKNSSRTDELVPANDPTFEFLSVQIGVLISHLQIADAKAAGTIAYVTVIPGYTIATTRRLEGLAPSGRWFLIAGTIADILSLIAAFTTILPRGWHVIGGGPVSWGRVRSPHRDKHHKVEVTAIRFENE